MDAAEAFLAVATLLTPAGPLHYYNPRLVLESECETRAYVEVLEMAEAMKGAVIGWSCTSIPRPSRIVAFQPKWRLADGRPLSSSMLVAPPPEED